MDRPERAGLPETSLLPGGFILSDDRNGDLLHWIQRL